MKGRKNEIQSLWLSQLLTFDDTKVLSGPCHHGMARLQVADRGTASDMEVAANKLNEQSWTADKGWSSSLGVGRGANNASLYDIHVKKQAQCLL